MSALNVVAMLRSDLLEAQVNCTSHLVCSDPGVHDWMQVRVGPEDGWTIVGIGSEITWYMYLYPVRV